MKKMNQTEIKEILTKYQTIAVVGLSRRYEKDSYRVATYLKAHGFRVVPVNPFADEILGEKSYKSLLDIPAEIQKQIEVVNIFRRPEDVSLIVEQAVKLKSENGAPNVVWMQLGIVNAKAAETARNAGFTVIMDKCIMVEHRDLFPVEA